MSIIGRTQVTAEALFDLPDDGLRHELIRGELTSMPPSGSEHSHETMWLGHIVCGYILEHGLGFPFGAEGGFLIGRDPDTVRAPDFAFVRKDRVQGGGLPRGFFPRALTWPSRCFRLRIAPWKSTTRSSSGWRRARGRSG